MSFFWIISAAGAWKQHWYYFVCCSTLKCVFFCHRCWLSVDNHFIWSFIGPVTFIIMVSCFFIFFFFECWDWRSEEGTERVSEMLQIKEVRWYCRTEGGEVSGIFFPLWWQVNFAAKTVLEASFNSLPLTSWQGSGFDSILFFNAFTQLPWSLALQMLPNGLQIYYLWYSGEKNKD